MRSCGKVCGKLGKMQKSLINTDFFGIYRLMWINNTQIIDYLFYNPGLYSIHCSF